MASNVDHLPPAFNEHTQTSPPQAPPPAPSFNSTIIDEEREGYHCLPGAVHGYPSEEELCGMCRSKSTVPASKYMTRAT